ncbi:hypothetical protein JXR93_13640 [bacterium]|nr:hypothetical protein [bacterium]
MFFFILLTLFLFFWLLNQYHFNKKNILFLLIFMNLFSCSSDLDSEIKPECNYNEDCIDGYSCIDTFCVKSCRNIICSENEICDLYTLECIPKPCQTDSDCSSEFYCNINGECKSKERYCSSSDECFSGYRCDLDINICKIESDICLKNDDCPFGMFCSSGECLPTLQCFDIFTNNNSKESAGEIELDIDYSMQLSPWYSDWYSFDYDGVSTIEFYLSFIHQNGDIDLKVYQNGQLITESNSDENYESILLKPSILSKGEIFIEVFLYQRDSQDTDCIFYELQGHELTLQCNYDILEPNNDYQNAVKLENAIGQLLTICNREKDIYKIAPTNKNDKYNFMLSLYHPENRAGVSGKLWRIENDYPMLMVKTETQGVIDYLEAELEGGKIYYLEIEGRNEYSYTYSLDYYLQPQQDNTSCYNDELEPNNATPTAITPDINFGSYFLSICRADIDWHPIQVVNGTKIQVIINFNQENGDLNLALYKFNGTQLEEISHSELTLNYEILSYQPQEDETIYIKVYPSGGSIENSYFIQILQID